MKKFACMFSAGVMFSALLLACGDSGTGGGANSAGSAGTTGEEGGSAGSGQGGTTSKADGGSNTTGGTGGSDAAGGTSGKGGSSTTGGSSGKTSGLGGSSGSGGAPLGGSGGTSGKGGTGGTGSSGSGGTGAQDCQGCLQTSCGAEQAACQKNQACVAAANCASACADQACANKCFADNPDGAADVQALAQCGVDNCTEACQGGGGSGGSAGSGTSGSGGSGQEDCASCQQTNCSAEIGQCQKNADCSAINQCATPCTDQACAEKCIADNPNGKADFEAAANCVSDNCLAQCQAGGVACEQIGLGDNGGPCDTCGHSNCCAEIEACFGNADCIAFNKCLGDNDCKDQACFDGCAKSNAAGAKLFNGVGSCIQSKCSTECGLSFWPAEKARRPPGSSGFFC